MKKRGVRELIWVPVIHAQADLGSMSESVRLAYVAKMGQAKWERHIGAVRDFWSRLEEQIESLRLPYERLRLYQDGLPNCGRELEIVKTLAEAGSLNCRLLLKLAERGAQVTGTESPELLLAEYDAARKTMGGQRGPRAPSHRRLLDLRDNYIAAQIDRTLAPDETGLIFLGMLHTLERRLPPDIRVRRVIVDLGSSET